MQRRSCRSAAGQPQWRVLREGPAGGAEGAEGSLGLPRKIDLESAAEATASPRGCEGNDRDISHLSPVVIIIISYLSFSVFLPSLSCLLSSPLLYRSRSSSSVPPPRLPHSRPFLRSPLASPRAFPRHIASRAELSAPPHGRDAPRSIHCQAIREHKRP